MAGIGFELRKIFKRQGIFNAIRGALYSTFTIIGPMLIIILCYVFMMVFMNYTKIDYYQRDLFASIVLYVFIFSLISVSPLSAVISRYIADKIFEERPDDIMSCYYPGLLLNTVTSNGACIIFIIITLIKGQADPVLIFVGGAMFISLTYVFYNMTFISALKEYKAITMTFLIGMGSAFFLGMFVYAFLDASFVFSALLGLAVGFFIIACILFELIKRFFKTNTGKYREFFAYIWRHRLMFASNMFYIVGLYIHNFVYWNDDTLSVLIGGTFLSAPVYDTATFLAMMTSISTAVIFSVRVETNFHSRYQDYCNQIIGGLGENIEIAKKKMFTTLIKEILFIVRIQAIITVILFLVTMVFASYIGFGGMVLVIYPSLAASYLALYIMYCMIIFLFYFDDGIGSFFASLIFFMVTLVTSIFTMHYLPHAFYGISLFAGTFSAWTFAFFRLKKVERNLDRRIFCKGELVRKVFIEGQFERGGATNIIGLARGDMTATTVPPK